MHESIRLCHQDGAAHETVRPKTPQISSSQKHIKIPDEHHIQATSRKPAFGASPPCLVEARIAPLFPAGQWRAWSPGSEVAHDSYCFLPSQQPLFFWLSSGYPHLQPGLVHRGKKPNYTGRCTRERTAHCSVGLG